MEFLNLVTTGKNSWWRYLLAFILIFLCFLAGFLFTFVFEILNFINLPNITFDSDEFIITGIGPFGYFLPMIVIYAITIIGVFLCVRFLHKRRPLTLITSKAYFSWKIVFIAFTGYLFFSLIETGYHVWNQPHFYKFNQVEIAKLANFTIGFLIFFSLQALLEELIHRGYLLQLSWLVLRNKYLAIAASSLLFMWGHTATNVYTLLYFLGVGVILGLMVVLTNGLEIPLGVHFAHNFWTVFIVYDPSIPEEYNAGLLINTVSAARSGDLLDILFTALKAFFIYIVINKVVKDKNVDA